MTERNTIQKPTPQAHSQSHHFETSAEVNDLESPPPSYEAAITGTDYRNQRRQAHSHGLSVPLGVPVGIPPGLQHQLSRQLQQLEQQLEQQRQQRELQRQQISQQLEEQRHQRQRQRDQLQLQLQQQQQSYPIQEYSSSNQQYQADTKQPDTSTQDYHDLEAQQETVASSSGNGIQVQTNARDRGGHRRGGCQHEDGKQRSGNCCVVCFGGCLAGCAACCYCCVVM